MNLPKPIVDYVRLRCSSVRCVRCEGFQRSEAAIAAVVLAWRGEPDAFIVGTYCAACLAMHLEQPESVLLLLRLRGSGELRAMLDRHGSGRAELVRVDLPQTLVAVA